MLMYTTPAYLLSLLGLCFFGEISSLYDVSHDGEAFPRLQLGGEGQQARVFDRLIRVNVQQHQQLRPGYMKREKREKVTLDCFES